MSKDKAKDRQFMRRSMIISIVANIFFVSVIVLLATSFGPVGPFVTFLGPVLTGVLAILILTLLFIGLVIFFGNLREYYGETAGWFEIVIFWIIIIVVAFVGFSWLHAVLTGLLCIGVVYYLHQAQD